MGLNTYKATEEALDLDGIIHGHFGDIADTCLTVVEQVIDDAKTDGMRRDSDEWCGYGEHFEWYERELVVHSIITIS